MKNIPRLGKFFLNSGESNISINIHDKIMFLSKVQEQVQEQVQLQVQYLLYILKYLSNETITDAR